MKNQYKLALSILPQLLDSSENPEVVFENIFLSLNEIFSISFGGIYFFNTTKLNIRYRFNLPNESNNMIKLSEETNQQLLSGDILVFNSDSNISKELNLPMNFSQFAICPLKILNTIFGFLLISKKNDKFTDEDKNILNSFSALCSYIIKDKELMGVFKMQFKVLQDDIEEKANAYKLIEEDNQRILKADSKKNEFIAKISHELRTPLNAILGFTEVLKEQFFGPLNEKQMEYIKDIHVSAVHLTGMINEILDISKIESNALTLNKTDLDIEPLIKEVVNVISPLANKKQIIITTNINFEMLYTGDYQKLQQILFNLLSNAIKFTPQNGKIEIGACQDKNNLLLWVKDSGIGIDPKYHGKIFGKFVQLENIGTKKESSTGLGLTITKELVKLHSGSIRIESKVNEGTTFIISLPLDEIEE